MSVNLVKDKSIFPFFPHEGNPRKKGENANKVHKVHTPGGLR